MIAPGAVPLGGKITDNFWIVLNRLALWPKMHDNKKAFACTFSKREKRMKHESMNVSRFPAIGLLACLLGLFLTAADTTAEAWGKKVKQRATSEKQAKKLLASGQKSLTKAMSLREKGRNDLALEELKRSILADPSLVDAYFLLSEIYTELEIPQKSAEMLEAGLPMAIQQEYDPREIGAGYCRLAQNYQALNKIDLASGALTYAAACIPDDPMPYKTLGDLNAATGKVEKAYAAYQKAVAIDPRNPDLWLALGNLALEQKTPKIAQEAYQGLVKCDSQIAEQFARRLNEKNLPTPATSAAPKPATPVRAATPPASISTATPKATPTSRAGQTTLTAQTAAPKTATSKTGTPASRSAVVGRSLSDDDMLPIAQSDVEKAPVPVPVPEPSQEPDSEPPAGDSVDPYAVDEGTTPADPPDSKAGKKPAPTTSAEPPAKPNKNPPAKPVPDDDPYQVEPLPLVEE
jgi:tetratricopeptide (TPR) repeat protein